MILLPDRFQGSVIKAMYFLSFASAAAWLTYFYVYLKEGAGLTGFEIGIIAGFQQFNNIFVLPVWGIWADRYGRKTMLMISMGGTLLLLPVFIFLEGSAAITMFMILVTLVYNPLVPLLDTVALDYEEQSMQKTNYGQIRMWGSIGWGMSSLLSGIFINKVELFWIFPLSSSLFLITWSILAGMYKPLHKKTNLEKLKRGIIWELLFTEKALFSFLILVFFYSMFSAPVYLMINVYYNELGASRSLLGLAFLVQGMSELPFFFYGKKLVEKFGAKKVFMFTMLVTSLRMLAYGLNSSPEFAVCLGLFNGISIGLFFVSIVAFVHSIVPSHLRSTGQSLIYTFYAVGVAMGNILTGFLDDFLSMKNAMILDAAGIIIIFSIILTKRIRYN